MQEFFAPKVERKKQEIKILGTTIKVRRDRKTN